MSNAGWGGDLDAAKEFHAKVHRLLDNGHRGRGGTRGGRGASNMTRGGNSFANTNSFTNSGNGGRMGLLTELPSHFWNPINTHGTQNTQAANIEDDPMTIDDCSIGGSQGAPGTCPAAAHAPAGHIGMGSAPTPTSWGTTTQPTQPAQGVVGSTPALWGSTNSCGPTNPARDRAASPLKGLGMSTHAAVNNNTNGPRDNLATDSQSATRERVTWGPRNIPVSNIRSFHSLARDPVTDQRMKEARKGTNSPQDVDGGATCMTSPAEAGRPWPGLKASRHAVAAGSVNSAGHTQSGALRRDLLQENGMLRGVQFTEDQGPQEDDDWSKTYNLNKVKDKCVVIAKQAFANDDHEAEKALHKVAAACSEVLRAKNVLKDKSLENEADKVLSRAQNDAWVHWIKFYHPTAPAADPTSIQISNKSPNVQMQDAPTTVPSQTVQVKVPSATTGSKAQAQAQASPATVASFTAVQALGAPQHSNFVGFGPAGLQQQSTHTAQQAQVSPQQASRTAQSDGRIPFGGLNSSNAQKTIATVKRTQATQRIQGPQQPTELTGLPSMFPQGLPSGFDDPQARKIFEDFFCHNKRLPRE